MFAYCGNNPVNKLDIRGTAEIGALSAGTGWLLGGLSIIDFATPIMEICGFVVGLAAVIDVIDTAITSEESKAESITTTAVAKREKEAIYFGIDFYGGSVNERTGPMPFEMARDWAIVTAASGRYTERAAWGLVTDESSDAMAMAISLGIPGPVSFDEARRNHLPHYHTSSRLIIDNNGQIYCGTNFHVWYSKP